MEVHNKIEEFLEACWKICEERQAPSIKVDQLTVSHEDSDLQQYAAQDLITIDGEYITLTEAGRAEARSTVRRHRLAERLFFDVIDVAGDLAEESACSFEHVLHRGIDEKICILLGHPQTCPHGKPIPRGRCCDEKKNRTEAVVTSLAELDPRQHGKIAYVHAKESLILHKLMSLGIVPGTNITLIKRFPSFVFEIVNSQFAVDETMARAIFVRVEDADSAEVSRHNSRPNTHRKTTV